jgi:hypothetical protein
MTEKIEAFWENATADDVAGIVKTGELVSARFRDSGTDDWQEYSLAGWKLRRSGARWIDSDGTTWDHCQVYREPSWWTKKPDPGLGYRLLEKLPDEGLKPGDEVWSKRLNRWQESGNANAGESQGQGYWYRRRIEPVEPEPKYKVDDRVKIIGPVPREKVNKNWERAMDALVGRIVRVKSKRLSVLDDGSSAWFYTVENTYEYVVREDYLASAPPAPPSHPMCRCEIAPEAIKPVKPEPKHYVLRVGDSVETPSGHRVQVISRSETQRFYALTAGDKLALPNGQKITITEKGFEVTQ